MSFYGIPEFLKDPKLLSLTTIFQNNGFEIRVVGGAVRDFIMGENPKDIDLCTNATPDEMLVLAEQHKLHLIPTGLQHGTVTFVIDHEPYEVTTLRIDTDTDGRHATVEFTRDFRKDAERRDLTINAMSMDMSGMIFDYFEGVHHTRMKYIEFVGNADERIREDYLRVLRYLRFFARMTPAGHEIPYDMIELFRQPHVVEGMKALSGERIWMELRKIIEADNAQGALDSLDRCNLFDCIVDQYDYAEPAIFAGGIFMDVKAMQTRMTPYLKDGYGRFKEAMTMAALASKVRPQAAKAVADRLKLSSDERKSFEYLNDTLWCDRYVVGKPLGVADLRMRFAYEIACGVEPSLANIAVAIRQHFGGVRRDYFESRIMVDESGNPIYKEIIEFEPFTLCGADLIARGIKPGKVMGDIIRMARNLWHEHGCTSNTTTLLNLILDQFSDLNQIVCVRETFRPPFKALYNSSEQLDVLGAHLRMDAFREEIMEDVPARIAVLQYFNTRDGAHVDILFANNKLAVEWKLTQEAR